MSPRCHRVGLALLLGGCTPAGPAARAVLPPPALRPSACRAVDPLEDLEGLLRQAHPAEAFCLAPGDYHGPVQVPAQVTVWGPRAATIHSEGRGTTVRVASGARLLGLTVDGSGGRFATLDAAVHVTGDDVTVQGVKIVDALFGVLVEQARRPRLIGNEVSGQRDLTMGLRGDAIRLWETTGGAIEDNQVDDSRDCVIWYSSDNAFRRNTVRAGRYGAHFMFSHRNLVEDNRFLGNEVGVFVMYSRDLVVRRNQLLDATGAAGMGLGVKESGNLTVEQNLLGHDTLGLYLDSSPLQNDEHNLFAANLFVGSQTAVVFHSSPSRNAFLGNAFRGNGAPVLVEGGGDALGVTWEGNDFDDYQGYDLDGDDLGDVPYELHSLSADLVAHYPALAFFTGAPVLALVSTAGHVVPLLTPTPVLRDARPRLHRRGGDLARALGVPHAN